MKQPPSEELSVSTFSGATLAQWFHQNCLSWYYKQLVVQALRNLRRRLRLSKESSSVVLPSRVRALNRLCHRRVSSGSAKPRRDYEGIGKRNAVKILPPIVSTEAGIDLIEGSRSVSSSTCGVFFAVSSGDDESDSHEKERRIGGKNSIRFVLFDWLGRKLATKRRKSILTQITAAESVSDNFSSLSGGSSRSGTLSAFPVRVSQRAHNSLSRSSSFRHSHGQARDLLRRFANQDKKTLEKPNWYMRRIEDSSHGGAATTYAMEMIFFDK
jgi:hypothetical protein